MDYISHKLIFYRRVYELSPPRRLPVSSILVFEGHVTLVHRIEDWELVMSAKVKT